jgi:hypothetical protein
VDALAQRNVRVLRLGDSANRGDGAGEMGDNLPAVKLIDL